MLVHRRIVPIATIAEQIEPFKNRTMMLRPECVLHGVPNAADSAAVAKGRTRRPPSLLVVLLPLLGILNGSHAFTTLRHCPCRSVVSRSDGQHDPNTRQPPFAPLRYHNDHSPSPGGTGGARFDAGDAALLEARLADLRRQALEEEYRRPPNPGLQATDFVAQLLRALWNNSDPRPDSGFRLLLRASTKEWRRKLYTAVAAPDGAREEVVASAVGEAMARPRNQYGILVGEEEEYYATFPTDVLDYGDGKCWVECRLRNKQDDALLAILGWELERRESDGAWLVGSIDWQDFRGTYVSRSYHSCTSWLNGSS